MKNQRRRTLLIFVESERARRRARGAYFPYASTLDTGIAKLSAKSTRVLGTLTQKKPNERLRVDFRGRYERVEEAAAELRQLE